MQYVKYAKSCFCPCQSGWCARSRDTVRVSTEQGTSVTGQCSSEVIATRLLLKFPTLKET
jgi:hypothetical protein